ncbi:MAG: hypothetical protein LBJ15_02530 [Comamonas sp.]|jgi:hypothetical protein|uniref:hypothetical protein n=1 Tax=Comamonas sp. TaxID=34028 RepID=UPI002830AC6C|nr:hypothetical protein [Comamonas sp.]MDR0212864.1 hypothetical protein [Comamonas sp.]
MKWQSIEVLPMEPDANVVFESETYLVTDGCAVATCDFCRGNGAGKPWAGWSMYGGIGAGLITHWMQMPAPPRCEYCDGTGDVHSLDGEWRGTCTCPAGKNPAPL